MKVFMYNKEEAKKNNCYTDKDPNIKVRLTAIYGALAICGALFLPIILLLVGLGVLLDYGIDVILWIGAIGYVIYVICDLIKWLSKYEYAKQTAVVKEENDYWAVRLTFIPEVGGAVNLNTATSVLSSVNNVSKVKRNVSLQEELYENRKVADVYIRVLNEARKENAPFMRDIHKNFNKVYNGSGSIVKLSNIKFKRETKDSYIYQYTDENGKNKTIEFIKAYPELREEI